MKTSKELFFSNATWDQKTNKYNMTDRQFAKLFKLIKQKAIEELLEDCEIANSTYVSEDEVVVTINGTSTTIDLRTIKTI